MHAPTMKVNRERYAAHIKVNGKTGIDHLGAASEAFKSSAFFNLEVIKTKIALIFYNPFYSLFGTLSLYT